MRGSSTTVCHPKCCHFATSRTAAAFWHPKTIGTQLAWSLGMALSPRQIVLFIAWLYLLVTIGLAFGCESQQQVERYEPPRSLILEQPRVQFVETHQGQPPTQSQSQVASNTQDDGLAWHDIRNDLRPTVNSGYVAPSASRTYTRTYDRFSIYNGRAHDSYRQYRVTESVTQSNQ